MTRKTAEELGVTQREYDDLVWVRDALDPTVPEVALPNWLKFDMRDWVEMSGTEARCGTTACLGGTLDLLDLARRLSVDLGVVDERDVEMAQDHSKSLSCLFYVWDHTAPRSAELAVRAVDRFLAGSKNPWGGNE